MESGSASDIVSARAHATLAVPPHRIRPADRECLVRRQIPQDHSTCRRRSNPFFKGGALCEWVQTPISQPAMQNVQTLKYRTLGRQVGAQALVDLHAPLRAQAEAVEVEPV
jgi:hypothetical protein